MKKIKTWFMLFAALFLSFTLVGCDLFGSDDEEDVPTEKGFFDYFNMTVTRCERVGNVLVIDYNVKNHTKTNVQKFNFNIGMSKIKDNLGNSYYRIQNSINHSEFHGSMNPTPILAGEQLTGTLRIKDFDPTNTTKSVSLQLFVNCPEFNLDRAEVTGDNLKITDKRVMAKGIQTNDTQLEWKYLGAERNGNDVILKMTVQNHTKRILKNFRIPYEDSIIKVLENCIDNMGQSYYLGILVSFDQGDFNSSMKTDIQPEETKNIRIRIPNMDPNATSITADMPVGSSSYAFSDNFAHLLNLPLK